MRNLLTAILVLFPLTSFAIVNEIAVDFGYDRNVYGGGRDTINVSRTYSAGLSTYFWDYTALDLTASRSSDVLTSGDRYNITTGIDIVGQQSRVVNSVYGIGLKQSFAPRNARLIPSLSAGYARQFSESEQDYTLENTTTNVKTILTTVASKSRYDSVYGTFALQLRLTERLSLKGSVKTLFPAFKFNQARDTVKYAIGFSWIF